MRRVLVLRPEPGASATVERAREHGLDAVAVPLFEVEPVQWEAPDPAAFDALLLTSANAVRHGGPGLQRLRELPAYAVGAATADSAREAGFTIAAVGDEGLDGLLASVPADVRLLHLCGEDRRAPDAPRQQITSVVVYRATAVPDPGLGDEGSVALVHSPRAGRRLSELVAANRSTIVIAAISPAAAEAVGEGWECVEVAAQPSDDALLALAARLCNKLP